MDELFGIYSFPQVHQMISTVSGELKDEISFSRDHQGNIPDGLNDRCTKKKSDGTDRTI